MEKELFILSEPIRKDFVLKADNDKQLLDVVKKCTNKRQMQGKFVFKQFLSPKRAYDLVAVLDESVSNEPYKVIKGNFIDLFDPKLPVYQSKTVNPGEQAFLLNIDRVPNKQRPQVLAAACRVYEEKVGKGSYSFVAKSPINTTNASRVC